MNDKSFCLLKNENQLVSKIFWKLNFHFCLFWKKKFQAKEIRVRLSKQVGDKSCQEVFVLILKTLFGRTMARFISGNLCSTLDVKIHKSGRNSNKILHLIDLFRTLTTFPWKLLMLLKSSPLKSVILSRIDIIAGQFISLCIFSPFVSVDYFAECSVEREDPLQDGSILCFYFDSLCPFQTVYQMFARYLFNVKADIRISKSNSNDLSKAFSKDKQYDFINFWKDKKNLNDHLFFQIESQVPFHL